MGIGGLTGTLLAGVFATASTGGTAGVTNALLKLVSLFVCGCPVSTNWKVSTSRSTARPSNSLYPYYYAIILHVR
jgi:ammonia channel protein AmtB